MVYHMSCDSARDYELARLTFLFQLCSSLFEGSELIKNLLDVLFFFSALSEKYPEIMSRVSLIEWYIIRDFQDSLGKTILTWARLGYLDLNPIRL